METGSITNVQRPTIAFGQSSDPIVNHYFGVLNEANSGSKDAQDALYKWFSKLGILPTGYTKAADSDEIEISLRNAMFSLYMVNNSKSDASDQYDQQAVTLLEQLAQQGVGQASFLLGWRHIKRAELDKEPFNLELIEKYYKQAGENGQHAAFDALGCNFHYGRRGFPIDFRKALTYYEHAFNNGACRYSYFGLIALHTAGMQTEVALPKEWNAEESRKSFNLIHGLALNRNKEASFTLGAYEEFCGSISSDTITHYESAEKGDMTGIYLRLAQKLVQKGDATQIDLAIKLYEKIPSNAGSIYLEAQRGRCLCLLKSATSEKESIQEKAKKLLYELYSEQGISPFGYSRTAGSADIEIELLTAMSHLYIGKLSADTVEYNKGIEHLETLAKRHVGQACHLLGWRHISDCQAKGEKPDAKKIEEYFAKAGKYGEYAALDTLGSIFHYGRYGVTNDYRKAVGCYQNATEHGVWRFAFLGLATLEALTILDNYYHDKLPNVWPIPKREPFVVSHIVQELSSLAEHGNPHASMALGIYWASVANEPDYQQAINYFELSEETWRAKGVMEGFYLSIAGKIGEKDPKAALQIYRKISKGHGYYGAACFQMASLYITGKLDATDLPQGVSTTSDETIRLLNVVLKGYKHRETYYTACLEIGKLHQQDKVSDAQSRDVDVSSVRYFSDNKYKHLRRATAYYHIATQSNDPITVTIAYQCLTHIYLEHQYSPEHSKIMGSDYAEIAKQYSAEMIKAAAKIGH